MNRLSICCTAILLVSSVVSAQDATPASVAQIPVASADSLAIRDFQKVEDAWTLSYNQHDQYGLELVLSPLLVDVSASGEITTRDQQVAQLINYEDKTLHVAHHVVTVRMLGDVAVVNGTYSLRHKVNGTPRDERGVFTHVFQRVRVGWLCVNSQKTLVRESSGSSASKAKKSTNAELPFHIPLLSKSDKSSQ